MRRGFNFLITIPLLVLSLAILAARADAAEIRSRPVFLAGGLKPDDLVTLTANVAAAGDEGIVLIDTPENRRYTQSFLASCKPSAVYFVGSFASGTEVLARDLKVKPARVMAWKAGIPEELWKLLFPRAERVVVCHAEPRSLYLQAACLAGAMRAPLFVLKAGFMDAPAMLKRLDAWGSREVYAVGATALKVCRDWSKGDVRTLPDEKAVVALTVKLLRKHGPVRTLVLANPTDAAPKGGGMSSLAPWVAIRSRGTLLFTNDEGKDAAAVVRKALECADFREAENLTIVADLQAIPSERRNNPLEGKDDFIELEPPGPREDEPFTLATGRLFFPDPGVVLLMLARQQLLAEATGPRKALIVSNPEGDLPLLETISRNTSREFRNAGYQTRAFFDEETSKEETRRLLPEQDIFLWEGHRSTLSKEYKAQSWEEPLRPSFVFLQSCLALSEADAQPFLRHGAYAVLGSSCRTYSASGGAFSLAYFDAVMYDDQSLGGALRQAKNFLLTFAMLKKKRLGEAATHNGATLRAAWAFTLWGDPTVKLPRPVSNEKGLPTVRTRVEGKRITLTIPEATYEAVKVEKYEAKTWPNARLAGYLTKVDEDNRRLSSLLFAEIRLTRPAEGKRPRLKSKHPESRRVFLWDERRSAGYLLVLPQRNGPKELTFDVSWDD